MNNLKYTLPFDYVVGLPIFNQFDLTSLSITEKLAVTLAGNILFFFFIGFISKISFDLFRYIKRRI